MKREVYDSEGFRTFREHEVNRKTAIARTTGALGGAIGAVILLVLTGNTGGHQLRGYLQEEREAHAEYRGQCEASLERAVAALGRAEAILEGR